MNINTLVKIKNKYISDTNYDRDTKEALYQMLNNACAHFDTFLYESIQHSLNNENLDTYLSKIMYSSANNNPILTLKFTIYNPSLHIDKYRGYSIYIPQMRMEHRVGFGNETYYYSDYQKTDKPYSAQFLSDNFNGIISRAYKDKNTSKWVFGSTLENRPNYITFKVKTAMLDRWLNTKGHTIITERLKDYGLEIKNSGVFVDDRENITFKVGVKNPTYTKNKGDSLWGKLQKYLCIS